MGKPVRSFIALAASLVVASTAIAGLPAPRFVRSAGATVATPAGATGAPAARSVFLAANGDDTVVSNADEVDESVRTIFVAADGDDTAPGSESLPLRTIQAAQAAVRAILSRDLSTNVRVSIASGTYPFASTLTLDERDSPADGYTVRYVGPADASAVLTGGWEVTGWEKFSGEVVRARLPEGISPSTLFENDQRAILARTPNDGYLRVEAAVGTDGSQTQFVYRQGDLPDGVTPTSSTVYIWTGCSNADPRVNVNYDWETDVAAVKTINPTTRTVTLAEATWFPICAGNRYFVQGARSLIDRAGEFAVEEGYVYYWPRSNPIEAQRITVPALARLVEVRGTSESALAKNIVFEQLTFIQTDAPHTATAFSPGRDNAGIHIENAENVAIRASRIADIGGSGIQLRGHAQRVLIEGNLIERIGVHGVWVRGPFENQPRVSKENRITNNRIRSGGRLHGSGSGVKLEGTAANEVSNNEISDMPRYGVSIKGTTLPQLQKSLPQLGATQQNLNDLRHSRENVIRRNDVFDVMKDSQDGGGIEMWGAGPANRVEENRVHDIDTGDRREGFTGTTQTRGPILRGIYIDDGSDGAIVRGNIVYGIRGPNAAPVTAKGIASEVSQNVLVCDGDGAGIETAVVADVPVERLRLTQNIIVRASRSDVYWFHSYSDTTIAAADQNVFFNVAGAYTVRFRFAGEVLTLEQWRTRYGSDKASVTADPLFVDATNRDYRVRDGSPAQGLGFMNVDPTLVGLRVDFPFGR